MSVVLRRGVLNVLVVAAIFGLAVINFSGRAEAQGCNDPCQWNPTGFCDCGLDWDYMNAVMFGGCCCAWEICWQGVTVQQGETQWCSPNCNDDVFECHSFNEECAI